MNMKGIFLLLLALVALSACATIPTGPSVMAKPGSWKPLEVFQSEDVACRKWASQRAEPESFEYEWSVQRRYDNAYMQCMYAKGNQVPGVTRPSRMAYPPPPPPQGVTPPSSGVYPPAAAQGSDPGNILPPPTKSQITPNPNQRRCQKWAPTGGYHTESRWNPQKQTMETVSVSNFDWQDYPCE
jgi:hypothetical protein